jgi:tRNA-dihydrouridine synthase A
MRLPDVFIGMNGGIGSLDEAGDHLRAVDGIMLGRAAYHTPGILAEVDGLFYGAAGDPMDPRAVVEAMFPYISAELVKGTRLSHIVRHMLGLFHGHPGARRWRRILTVGAVKPGAGLSVVREALAALGSDGEARLDIPHRIAETPAVAIA